MLGMMKLWKTQQVLTAAMVEEIQGKHDAKEALKLMEKYQLVEVEGREYEDTYSGSSYCMEEV